ncbi:MAG: undecaprenyldiphospho-muramoylpentapeptide beta-N-acetylglucosaminyltransferase [Candidatus Riflebacteria bacterium]|nr:undecaprenyldiphospho-muramoylpentapeptide beta-N-acetylglucosaminyltransferase [Candidatus Riflebacteria bacterium]
MHKKVAFSGGGTGGHIYPALAIREILQERLSDGIDCLYLGQADGMEAGIVGRTPDLSFGAIRAQGMPRNISTRWLTFPYRNVMGFFDALGRLRVFAPDLVVTTGGFVAFPVLAAAKLLGIPYVIHEQNAAIGFTNRLFVGTAARVLLTYEEAWPEKSDRVVLTGNPVRKAFLAQNSTAAPGTDSPSRFAKKPGEFWILAVGGSRGAASLNRACVELSKDWLEAHPGTHLLHITGERDFAAIKAQIPENGRHTVLPYLHEMREAFDVADMIISRAGATILAEIACRAKPAILVPFPFATNNHQEKNARILEKMGAAQVIPDHDLNGSSLGMLLNQLRDENLRAKMAEAMRNSRPADVEERIFATVSPLL